MRILIAAVATILLTRTVVAAAGKIYSWQFIFQDNLYHLYYGVGIIIFSLVFRFWVPADIFFGIGAGLVIDDLAAFKYILGFTSTNPQWDYWSPLFIIPQLLGILILAVQHTKFKKIFLKEEQ